MTMLGYVGRTALNRLKREIEVQVAVAWNPSEHLETGRGALFPARLCLAVGLVVFCRRRYLSLHVFVSGS
jgi:hypothetical protein